ncbi:uncharacterized protein V6R79_011512 [Siganus canaliculatus]
MMKLALLASLLVVIPCLAAAGSCVGKNVEVWVTNGNDLTGDGPVSNPDPYVILKIGNQVRRTSTVYGSANPNWWERFEFKKVDSNIMIINIWEADSGLRGDDDHLGTCVVPLESGGDKYRNIRCDAKDQGYVKLYYKCK